MNREVVLIEGERTEGISLANESLQGRFALRHFMMTIGLLLGLAVFSGCSTARYLSMREVRENPLAASLQLFSNEGPEISVRTRRTLRRFDLEDHYHANPTACFAAIRQRVQDRPESDLIYALSELSYVEGKKAERLGRLSEALNHYGVSLTNSYEYLFSNDLSAARNVYDPQFRAVCDLYNESLEDTLRILCSDSHLEPGQTYTIETLGHKFVVRTEMRGNWDKDEFDHYEFVSDYAIETLRNRHTTYGLGVPLIAVRKDVQGDDQQEKYYADGLSYSVTALMRCVDQTDEEGSSNTTTCVLEFFDPLTANQVLLSNDWVPLETDLSTPLAFFLDSPEFQKRNQATEGLLNPARSQSKRGLYMLEPYDPNRIPVLMVHGLWSSPVTWMDMFNDLRSFPEIRERYQFWFYLYPSGQPFWISATQLRRELAEMRDSFDPHRRDTALDQMVLVGHSMGGLISRLQTMDSQDDFWKIVSDEPVTGPADVLAKVKGPDDAKEKLVSTLFFEPNESIKRVITIGTPHRGSEFANVYTRWLARKLIRLPKMLTNFGDRLAMENPRLLRNTQLLTVANALDSLAPESPIFPVMMRAKKNPEVKYHNVIGVLKNSSLLSRRNQRGDGVVDYGSATMTDVESELIVDANHTDVHMIGKTIFEVRRILLKHLAEIDWEDRVARDGESSMLATERIAEGLPPQEGDSQLIHR